MNHASLAIFLHAHLPYVRPRDNPESPAHRWLFDALTDAFIPFTGLLERLDWDNVPGRLLLAVSPNLIALLDDSLLTARFVEHLDRRIESVQAVGDADPHSLVGQLAHWEADRLRVALIQYEEACGRDLLGTWLDLHQEGRLALIASAGWHSLLPLVESTWVRRRTIHSALARFRDRFGFESEGLWVPECAVMDEVLEDVHVLGARFTVVPHHQHCRPTHPSVRVLPAERYDIFETEPDLASVLRSTGYRPGAPQRIRGLAGPTGASSLTAGNTPRLYQPRLAYQAVQQHAQLLALEIASSAETTHRSLATDLAYLGVSWFEGTAFLETLVRQAQALGVVVDPFSGPQKNQPEANQMSEMDAPGSLHGHLERWVSRETLWMLRALKRCEARFEQHQGNPSKAFEQATRELLLAQQCDWLEAVTSRQNAAYATERFKDHLGACNGLLDNIESEEMESELLCDRLERYGHLAV